MVTDVVIINGWSILDECIEPGGRVRPCFRPDVLVDLPCHGAAAVPMSWETIAAERIGPQGEAVSRLHDEMVLPARIPSSGSVGG